jgi:hypothetical protein
MLSYILQISYEFSQIFLHVNPLAVVFHGFLKAAWELQRAIVNLHGGFCVASLDLPVECTLISGRILKSHS